VSTTVKKREKSALPIDTYGLILWSVTHIWIFRACSIVLGSSILGHLLSLGRALLCRGVSDAGLRHPFLCFRLRTFGLRGLLIR
jgi:hypothetical protein